MAIPNPEFGVRITIYSYYTDPQPKIDDCYLRLRRGARVFQKERQGALGPCTRTGAAQWSMDWLPRVPL